LTGGEAEPGITAPRRIDLALPHHHRAVRGERRGARRLAKRLERLGRERTGDRRTRVEAERGGGDQHHLAVAQAHREIPLLGLGGALREPRALNEELHRRHVQRGRSVHVLRRRGEDLHRIGGEDRIDPEGGIVTRRHEQREKSKDRDMAHGSTPDWSRLIEA
jgi:hypothetical protein